MNIRAAICGLFFFAALGAIQPAAAAGCTGNPDVTIFTIKTNTNYDLRFYVWRDGDKIRGKMYFNASRPGDASGEGSVDGQFFPPSGIFMQVFLYPPAPPGTRLLITGDFFKGDGRGQLKQTDWGANAPQTIWSAETVEGCPKWPNDPEPPKPEPVNILTTDQCEAAALKSPFPSHLGVTHPCVYRTTSGTVSADVLNALDKEKSLTRRDDGWTTPLFGGDNANGKSGSGWRFSLPARRRTCENEQERSCCRAGALVCGSQRFQGLPAAISTRGRYVAAWSWTRHQAHAAACLQETRARQRKDFGDRWRQCVRQHARARK